MEWRSGKQERGQGMRERACERGQGRRELACEREQGRRERAYVRGQGKQERAYERACVVGSAGAEGRKTCASRDGGGTGWA